MPRGKLSYLLAAFFLMSIGVALAQEAGEFRGLVAERGNGIAELKGVDDAFEGWRGRCARRHVLSNAGNFRTARSPCACKESVLGGRR